MADFPHLKLPFKVAGTRKISGGGGKGKAALTIQNETNRQQHGQYLQTAVNTITSNWENLKSKIKDNGIELPNGNDIPVFLRIDTNVFDIDSLLNWGIEVVSEEQEGYIIGASLDNLNLFKENINQFLNQKGTYQNTAAKVWELVADDSWRISQLLKGELGRIWESIQSNVVYTIELGISCYVPNKKNFPDRNNFDSESIYQQKVDEYIEHEKNLQIERDAKQILRENEIEEYVKIYNGVLHDVWNNDVDAVYFKISVSGSGLKDIVLTYQYAFEIKLDSSFSVEMQAEPFDGVWQLEVIAPPENTSKVCVIDSGIQESHRLIAPAIDYANSRSYVDGDTSTADYVKQSGHGTKVAGAILFPHDIPTHGQYQLESIIQNARILNRDNKISQKEFTPTLLGKIINDFPNTRLFNLSVCDDDAYINTHMPSVAASIDKLTHEKNILFIVAAGNLFQSSSVATNPGIREYLASGNMYPQYLNNEFTNIANPAVSYFAITVGSIGVDDFEDEDYKTLAGKDYISPFSRTGLGMWGNIKPDVVEFGGDLVKNKLSSELKTVESICPELINSTMYNANLSGKDSYGTSFSTPKVSYIASRLQTEHPNETSQMYRALIIQSARLPSHCFNHPTLNDFRYYGYGLPNVDRALNNSIHRITFIQNGNVEPKKADIYHVKIPQELRGEGRNFQLLIEVTLAFTSKTRVTRKGAHSYLSNWLEWQSSKYNEGFKNFRNRTIDYLELNEEEIEAGTIEEGLDAIKWCLRENPAWTNNGINRNNSTVQKSWVIVQPHQLADEFSLAVIGHVGWDKNLNTQIPYALCVSFEAINTEINIYNLIAEAQVEIQPEIEIEL